MPTNKDTQAAGAATLTDAQIDAALAGAVRSNQISWVGYDRDSDGRYTIPAVNPFQRKLVRIGAALACNATAQSALREVRPAWSVTQAEQDAMSADQWDAWKAALKAESEPSKLWCETCEGTGKVHQEHQAGCWVGGEHQCPDCDGKGYWVRLASTGAAPSSPTDATSAVIQATHALLRHHLENADVHPCDVQNDAVRASACIPEVGALYAALSALSAPDSAAPSSLSAEVVIEWIKNNYQDHTIASLCEGIAALTPPAQAPAIQAPEAVADLNDTRLHMRLEYVRRKHWMHWSGVENDIVHAAVQFIAKSEATPSAAVSAGPDPEVAQWIEEALTYVGSPSWSPSMEREGRALLAKLTPAPAPTQPQQGSKP